jgi:hypothetical protein
VRTDLLEMVALIQKKVGVVAKKEKIIADANKGVRTSDNVRSLYSADVFRALWT